MSNDSTKHGIRPHNWISAEESFDEIVEWVVRAEERGFDSVHAVDRMLSKVPPIYETTAYEVTTALTTYAAHTDSVQLGPLVYILPYRNPIQVAKQFAAMDIASNGRLVFAVGAGWNAHEFEALGVPRRERGKRLEEGVEVLKRLWTEDHVDHDGDIWSFEDVSIDPKPVQDPHPPIWFGSFGPEVDEFTPVIDRVLRRIGRLGDGWAPLVYSTEAKEMIDAEKLGRAWERIVDGARDSNRDPEEIEIIYSVWPYVMEDEDAEREECYEAVSGWFDGTYQEAKRTYPIGSAEEVADRIAKNVSELPRVDRFIFTPFNYDHAQMDRLRDEVIPRLEEHID
ncbi:LLM class flavin-dependent oxidoreductase [Saliphagus sp. GCM10025308]